MGSWSLKSRCMSILLGLWDENTFTNPKVKIGIDLLSEKGAERSSARG